MAALSPFSMAAPATTIITAIVGGQVLGIAARGARLRHRPRDYSAGIPETGNAYRMKPTIARATHIGGIFGRKPGRSRPSPSNTGHTDRITVPITRSIHKGRSVNTVRMESSGEDMVPIMATPAAEIMGQETVVGRATMALAAPDSGRSLRKQSSR